MKDQISDLMQAMLQNLIHCILLKCLDNVYFKTNENDYQFEVFKNSYFITAVFAFEYFYWKVQFIFCCVLKIPRQNSMKLSNKEYSLIILPKMKAH